MGSEVTLKNVLAQLDMTVSKDGRIFGLSKYAEQRVTVVVYDVEPESKRGK